MKQTKMLAVLVAGLWGGMTDGVAQVETRSLGEIITAARLEAALNPVAEKTIPLFTLTPATPPGTYWMLQADTPPLPFDPFPELMIFPLGPDTFLVDDRSVDYPALNGWLAAEARARRLLERGSLDGMTLMNLESEGPPSPPGGRRGYE